MSHNIRGFVIPAHMSSVISVLSPNLASCALRAGGLVFVPVGSGLEVADAQTEGHFACLAVTEEQLRELSRSGSIAYIETEYWGGDGVQSATAWRDGAVLMPRATAAVGPINEALRLLGVFAAHPRDEFATAGLAEHRCNDDWIAESRSLASPPNPSLQRTAQSGRGGAPRR